jgi:4-hydroxy 2-oxovalerate aldolase
MEKKECLLLDCTLRDGGYNTNWDFDEKLVDTYLAAINKLPIDIIEIGYRSFLKETYAGAHFYLPEFLIEKIKSKTSKDLAIILNEKDLSVKDAEILLKPCVGKIDLVRLAVAPVNFNRGIELALKIKELGFQVAFNLMYASKWEPGFPESEKMQALNKGCNYFNIVDSYGGLFPEDVKRIFTHLNSELSIAIGFHGHNNLELALINSLEAIDCGAAVIDATIDGMGRGAGNLKTELLLSVLYQRNKKDVDFDILNEVREAFVELKTEYNWGTNLSYMVSGSFSLPQNKVKAQVNKRYFSLNRIIENLTNKPTNKDNHLDVFKPPYSSSEVLIIGGGKSVEKHKEGLRQFLSTNPKIPIIFASSKNVGIFVGLKNPQIHLIPGREFMRLKRKISKQELQKRILILSPTCQISEDLKNNTCFKLPLQENYLFPNSVTEYCIKSAKTFKTKKLLLSGYDGYGKIIRKDQQELFEENEMIFEHYSQEMEIKAVTPSEYSINKSSIYSLL